MDDELRIELANYSVTRSSDGHLIVDFIPVRSPGGEVRVHAVWKIPLGEVTKLTEAFRSMSIGPPASTARN